MRSVAAFEMDTLSAKLANFMYAGILTQSSTGSLSQLNLTPKATKTTTTTITQSMITMTTTTTTKTTIVATAAAGTALEMEGYGAFVCNDDGCWACLGQEERGASGGVG